MNAEKRLLACPARPCLGLRPDCRWEQIGAKWKVRNGAWWADGAVLRVANIGLHGYGERRANHERVNRYLLIYV